MQWEMQFGKDFSCLFREERSSQSAQGPRLVGPSRSSEKYASSYHEYELLRTFAQASHSSYQIGVEKYFCHFLRKNIYFLVTVF